MIKKCSLKIIIRSCVTYDNVRHYCVFDCCLLGRKMKQLMCGTGERRDTAERYFSPATTLADDTCSASTVDTEYNTRDTR